MSLDPSAVWSVIKWIDSLSFEEGKFLYQVPEEVDGLKRDLQHIVEISKYAEEHPNAVSGHDRICIEALRKLTFRSEDVLDTYLVKGIQTKVENSNILKKFAYTCFNGCLIHQIGNEIETIQRAINSEIQGSQKFKGIISNISEEGLGFSSADRRLRNEPGRVLVRREEYIVGIEKEIQILVDQVLKDDQSPQLGFLAIIGTGGAGKTTLAKEVYGHIRVKSRFKSRIMVSISKEWNAKDILVEMILQAMQVPSNDKVKSLSQSELVNKLYIFLENTSYLFVIDDIWEKDAWDIVSPALPKSYGSKVILTTRNQTLPSSIDRRCFIFEPKVLETKDKYELIHKIAVEGRSNTNIKEFEALALNMAERCSGIPLAVVALSGVLNTKNEIYEWKSVSRAIDTHILQGEDYDNIRVESIIALSYYDLPYNVRPCLLYLSVFSEDSEIQSEEAIALWIGEGLVTTKDLDNQQERLEDIGIQYIEELVKRCLLKAERRNHRGHVPYFKIHELVRDFCIKKAKEQYFSEVILSNDNQPVWDGIRKIQARRIVFQSLRSDMGAHTMYKTEALRMERCSQLQVLELARLLVDEEGHSRPIKFPPNLVHLTLFGVKLKQYPESFTSIGKLCHLKSLYLSGVNTEPFSFKQNLFLQLENLACTNVAVEFDGGGQEVGSVVLPCLQTLRLYLIDRLPKGLGHLTSLQELVIVTRNGELAARLKKGDEDGTSSQGADFHMIRHIPSVDISVIGNKNQA